MITRSRRMFKPYKFKNRKPRDPSRSLTAKRNTVNRFHERYAAKKLEATFEDYLDYLAMNDWDRYCGIVERMTGLLIE